VWWISYDGGLLVLLPVLLKKSKIWQQCDLRIFTVAMVSENADRMREMIGLRVNFFYFFCLGCVYIFKII
jgi:hypothetical protein